MTTTKINGSDLLPPARRVVWVIEFRETSKAPAPRYWDGGDKGWTWEIDEAIQFAREEDCRRYMRGMMTGLGLPREHVIIGGNPMVTGRTIKTSCQYPPISDRRFDWLAYFDGHEEGPQGWGRTEADAVADLINNYEPDEASS